MSSVLVLSGERKLHWIIAQQKYPVKTWLCSSELLGFRSFTNVLYNLVTVHVLSPSISWRVLVSQQTGAATWLGQHTRSSSRSEYAWSPRRLSSASYRNRFLQIISTHLSASIHHLKKRVIFFIFQSRGAIHKTQSTRQSCRKCKEAHRFWIFNCSFIGFTDVPDNKDCPLSC